MGTIRKSAELIKQSWRVLRQDKELVVFPIFSSIACVLVLASFAVPMFMAGVFEQLTNGQSGGRSSGNVTVPIYMYLVVFAFYLLNYLVIVFFNTALVSCAMDRFAGKNPTVGSGLKAAAGLFPQIFGWAMLSATVGTILKIIQDKAGWLGKIVAGLTGMAWAIATYFVVPVLVVERVGPVDAVKRSTEIMMKTWGKALVANIGLGLIGVALFFVAILPLVGGIALTIAMDNGWPVLIGGALFLICIVVLSLVMSTIKMITVAALYRFAAHGETPEGFDSAALQGAFRAKN